MRGSFFQNRNVAALVSDVADWNVFIAAGVGAFDELVGGKAVAPIKNYPDFEHLEAQGQDQIDGLLRWIKGCQTCVNIATIKMDLSWRKPTTSAIRSVPRSVLRPRRRRSRITGR